MTEFQFKPGFDLTRAEADADIAGNLASANYLKFLFSKRHADGPYICIGHVPNFPCVYVVQWRASHFWIERVVQYVAAFEAKDPDTGWYKALKIAQEAFEIGPRGPVLDKGREKLTRQQEHLRETNASSRGGKAKAEKDRANNAQLVEALRRAKKFGFNVVPKFDPKKWEYGADVEKGPARFTFCRVGTNQEVCVETIVLDTDEYGRKVDPYWRVRRYWPANKDADSAILEDDVIGFKSDNNDYNTDDEDNGLSRVIPFVERVLLSDPRFWNKNDVASFL